MAKGVQLNDDQLENFSGGKSYVLVEGSFMTPARILDLDGYEVHQTYYVDDAKKWAKEHMSSGDKLYSLPTNQYNLWQLWKGACGPENKGWKKKWSKEVKWDDPLWIQP